MEQQAIVVALKIGALIALVAWWIRYRYVLRTNIRAVQRTTSRRSQHDSYGEFNRLAAKQQALSGRRMSKYQAAPYVPIPWGWPHHEDNYQTGLKTRLPSSHAATPVGR